MLSVYVLKLQEEKYYVGKSYDIENRLKAHIAGTASRWTSLYKPICLQELIENCVDEDEDKYTLIYMKNYGIDNVRGGSFCSIQLDYATKLFLLRMIKGSSDKCFNCGDETHFSNECCLDDVKKNAKNWLMVSIGSALRLALSE